MSWVRHKDSGRSVEAEMIPKSVREAVKRRSGGLCEWIDPVTKKRCCNSHNLEMAHIINRSQGGKDTEENILHLCYFHHHNELHHLREVDIRRE